VSILSTSILFLCSTKHLALLFLLVCIRLSFSTSFSRTLDSDRSIFLIYFVTSSFSCLSLTSFMVYWWYWLCEPLCARLDLLLIEFVLLFFAAVNILSLLKRRLESALTRCICFYLTWDSYCWIYWNFYRWDYFLIFMKAFSFYSRSFCFWIKSSCRFLLIDCYLLLKALIFSSKIDFIKCLSIICLLLFCSYAWSLFLKPYVLSSSLIIIEI